MKRIGNDIELVESWSELTQAQRDHGIWLLYQMEQGELTPDDFRLRMLLLTTGYKPAPQLWRWLRQVVLSFCRFFGISTNRNIEISTNRDVEISTNRNNEISTNRQIEQETITFNLLQLSQLMDFAFTESEQGVLELKAMATPCPPILWNASGSLVEKSSGSLVEKSSGSLVGGNASGSLVENITQQAPLFDLTGEVLVTNLTAGQYLRACDYLNAYYTAKPEMGSRLSVELMQHIAAELYKIDYYKLFTVPPHQLYGTMLWFTGVVEYWQRHPKYRVLFRRNNDISTNRNIEDNRNNDISKSRNIDDPRNNDITTNRQNEPASAAEQIFALEKAGAKDIENMRLDDYFDVQLQALKDRVQHALAEGVKKIDLIAAGVPAELLS